MHDILMGCIWIALYFVVLAASVLAVRFTVRVPDEVFRKLLHGILLGSLLVWTWVFPQWWMACVTAVGFAVVVWPILLVLEHLPRYSQTVTERKKGELKRSLLVVFGMYAAVAALCWGWLGDRYLLLGSVYAWGIGDGAAALVGKWFGRRRIHGKKTLEGTLTMFAVSAVSVAVVLLVRGGLGAAVIPAALLTALVSALTELYTPGGWDTITCPMAAMATLTAALHLCGGIV